MSKDHVILRKFMAERNISHASASEILGVSKSTVSRMLAGMGGFLSPESERSFYERSWSWMDRVWEEEQLLYKEIKPVIETTPGYMARHVIKTILKEI